MSVLLRIGGAKNFLSIPSISIPWFAKVNLSCWHRTWLTSSLLQSNCSTSDSRAGGDHLEVFEGPVPRGKEYNMGAASKQVL